MVDPPTPPPSCPDLDNLLKRVEELQDLVEKARKPTMDFLKSRGTAPQVSKKHYEEVYLFLKEVSHESL